MKRRPPAFRCLVLALLLAPAVQAADWPRWRGPHQDGTSLGNGAFDREPFGLEVVWTKALGSGYSSVSVTRGRAVTMFSDGQSDVLVALDPASGRELWRYRIADTYRGHDDSSDGPASTPAIDGDRVFGLGPHGHLFSVRLADGGEIWARQIDQGDGARPPVYGFATTPLVAGEVVVVQTGGPDGHSLTGFDRRTGEPRWSFGDDPVGYQSPLLLDLAGRRQVVAVGNGELVGLVPETGEPLWRHRYAERAEESGSQPVAAGDDRFLVVFNNDAALFQVQATEAGYALAEVWRSTAFKGTYAVPVLYQGHLYGFDGNFLTCVAPATGETVWKSRPPGGKGLILVDGHLVINAHRGDLVVAEATPEGYRERTRLAVSDLGTYTPPSFAGGRIYLRDLEKVAAVAVRAAERVTALPPPPSPAVRHPESRFAAFVRRVEGAEDKAAVIDQFFASQAQFPLVEEAPGGGSPTLVHFVYRGQAEDVAVVGSMTDFDLPEPMARIPGTDLHHRSYEIEPGARWEYQVSVDFGPPMPDPLNPRKVPNPWGGELSEVATPGWRPPSHIAEPEGPRGRIESWKFKSEILGNEREVKVYLPAGYDQGEARYPLLVVNDGPRALQHGHMANTLDNLIGERVAPLIVAFVPPAPPMFLEYGGSRTQGYVDMLRRELIPHLEERYRTVRQAQARGIMGMSLGGLVAAYAALQHPEDFGRAGVQSLAWFPPLSEQMAALLAADTPATTRFYVDWNRYEWRSEDMGVDMRELNRGFYQGLKDKGYPVAGGEALDGVGWGSWRARTDRVLTALFPLGGGG